MQVIQRKNVLQIGSLLIGLACNHQAMAHDQAGSLTAAAGASATDYYQVTCSSDAVTNTATDHLFFSIRDVTAGGNLVGMTVIKADAATNQAAYSTIDLVGGTADTTYSPSLSIKGGNGVYNVAVWHTGVAATESYTFQYHCQNAAGTLHTPTSILRISNQ